MDAEWEYAAQFDDERNMPWGGGDPGNLHVTTPLLGIDYSRANVEDTKKSGIYFGIGNPTAQVEFGVGKPKSSGSGNSMMWTTPVGSYPDAPEELGLSDMAGNVKEWCNDWWTCELGTAPVINPKGPDSESLRVYLKVLRGGWWRCAMRSSDPPDKNAGFMLQTYNPEHFRGFRIARSGSR
jgi:formylglycine-generating enzyme required for sulfatase activity